MKRLLDNIGGRPVFILLHGASVKLLEGYITQFRGASICYASINRFNLLEQNILSKIGERFSLIHCHANPGLEQFAPRLAEFLRRPDRNMLMTTEYAAAFFNTRHAGFIDEFREKLWLTSDFRHIRANSLMAFLAALMKAMVKDIILFGADGCADKSMQGQIKSYYHPETFEPGRTCAVTWDTTRFNMLFPTIEEQYRKDGTRILNCSPGSLITCIPQISYDDLPQYTGG